MQTPLRFRNDPAHSSSQYRSFTAKSVQPARRSGRTQGRCGMRNAGSRHRGLYTLSIVSRQADVVSAAAEISNAADKVLQLSDVQTWNALAHGAQQI